MPGFLNPRKGMPLLLIPSGINKGQRVPDRSKTAHRKPLVKCFLTALTAEMGIGIPKNISREQHSIRQSSDAVGGTRVWENEGLWTS